MEFDSLISKFAFIFLVYAVITSGFVEEVLSCQMRYFLTHMIVPRHLFGILLIFVFIMMEGGWSFDEKLNDAAENDWSSGNVVDSILMAVGVYTAFLFSSKAQLVPNLLFFGSLFILYLINTQRRFYLARKKISEDSNEKILFLEKGIAGFSLLTLAYGFIDYIFYQKANYGSKFDWYLFFMGKAKCASLVNN